MGLKIICFLGQPSISIIKFSRSTSIQAGPNYKRFCSSVSSPGGKYGALTNASQREVWKGLAHALATFAQLISNPPVDEETYVLHC